MNISKTAYSTDLIFINFYCLLSGAILSKFQVRIFIFVETRAILSRLVGEILPRCENTTFFIISVFYVLPNKIHYGCSFALLAGFVIIFQDIFTDNEIKINFHGEILTFFVIFLSPEGLKYNKVLTKSIYLTVPIHDYIINIIVLIKVL